MRGCDDGIAVLVLAAGGGSRMGGGKLLLPWRGRPILAHVLERAVALEQAVGVVVVAGHDRETIGRTALAFDSAATPVAVVENPAWRGGQSTSLKAGITAIREAPALARAAGVMIMLGDQPRVSAATLSRLASSHIRACAADPGHPATAPFHAGTRGNPVVVSPVLFPDIMRLEGDVGARRILVDLGGALLSVPVDDPGILADVDTPEEYARLDVPE